MAYNFPIVSVSALGCFDEVQEAVKRQEQLHLHRCNSNLLYFMPISI